MRPATLRPALAVAGLTLVLSPCLATAQIAFEDRASDAGVDFVLRNAPTPRKRMIETMAGGLAVFDYDSDGRPDLFFTNGAAGEGLAKSSPEYFNRLYRNQGGLRFADVTETAGVAGQGYSMGAAAADFDNDGDADLFVAGVFRNILYRNNGDGTFADVTDSSGITSAEWAVAAGWFDHDGDALLDLLVVNYADWTTAYDRYCGDRERGLRVYCHPKYLTRIANRLYRNLGDGRFEDITRKAALHAAKGRGMSAAFADFDGNGRLDILVTNDNLANFLFLAQRDGTYLEDALLAGTALLDHGRPVASMGVDVGDFDGDGLADLSVTALSNETFPLFRGEPGGAFRDATVASGLARLAREYAGWGNAFGDFDNDGQLDLFTANSHVNDLVEHFEPFAYKQPNTVFRNAGGRFAAASEVGEAGAHRGAVAADLDSDGRLDVAVSALGERAKLLRNVSSGQGSWIALDLEGTESSSDAVGARIRIGNRTRWVKSAVGYASSRSGPVHFGLGTDAGSVTVEVSWPSGIEQTVEDVPVGRRTAIKEPARAGSQ